MKTYEGKNFPIKSPQKLLKQVSEDTGLPTPRDRRMVVQQEMAKANEKGLDCLNCSGMCCTYKNNSMQVDAIQALEILAWLESEERVNEELIESLDKVILEFRLNKDFMLGRNREFRRTYTCPFFMQKNQGCSLSRSVKPYGCLAFNPLEKKVSTEGKCASNIEILTEREALHSDIEEKANKALTEELGLYWNKKSMPFALREILTSLKRRATTD
ncbi:MAG: hypothetical protein KC478_03965 [Bacteriovoracaceae bacterium]|nr:hypothetical protein [Bacteriovoracaceae bacterium]